MDYITNAKPSTLEEYKGENLYSKKSLTIQKTTHLHSNGYIW